MGTVSVYDSDGDIDDENDSVGVTDDVNEREGVTELVRDRVADRVGESDREGLAGATQQLHVVATGGTPAQLSTQTFEAPHCGAQQPELACSERGAVTVADAMTTATAMSVVRSGIVRLS